MKLFEYTGISTTVNHAVAIFMLLHKHDIERFVVYNAPDDMMTSGSYIEAISTTQKRQACCHDYEAV